MENSMNIIVYCIVIVLILLFLGIILILSLPRIVYGKLKYNKNKHCDAIVILGHPALKDGTPSPILRERIKKGIELYNKNISSKIIGTGSAVKNEYIEAEIIKKELLKAGIPEKQIICENKARSTWDNIKYLKEIMEKEHLNEVVIVSNPAHVRRASIYAKKFDIKHTVEESNIPNEIPNIFLGIIYLYIYYGITKYIIRNIGKNKLPIKIFKETEYGNKRNEKKR
jgi:uncharacterized SAM-binding protein YcdF (DUF218 family)